jgi:diguanylate cyclase (GGDEF)-like protein/PAS domain S-box-containing protein
VDKKILRLLVVDDSPDDTELAVAAIRKQGFMIKSQRVQDLAGMTAALDKGAWDVVVSEADVPHFGAQMALDLLRRLGHDIPFLILSRNIRDADMAKLMQAGARDVVRKTDLARLALAIDRELTVAADRRALVEARKALTELEAKQQALVETTREAVAYLQDGMHVNANKNYLALFGYEDAKEIEGVPVMDLIDKTDHARFKEFMRKQAKGGSGEPQEFIGMKPDGARLPLELNASPVTFNGEACMQLTVSDVSRRKAVESKLQYLNQRDTLTGLFNRHHFIQELTKTVEQVHHGASAAALLYIDLAGLKLINEKFGYAAGDRFLIRIAKVFREKLGDDTLLSRFGGDEFAALLTNKGATEAKRLAASLEHALEETKFSEGGHSYSCQCSLSITQIDTAIANAQQALSHAYQATQSVKGTGEPLTAPAAPVAEKPPAPPRAVPPPRAVLAIEPASVVAAAPAPTPKPSAPARAAASAGNPWAARLEAALAKDDFTLTYQPIINLHGDPAELYEILLRLHGEKGELINAGQFMLAAEQSGLVTAIDRWVVKQAVAALAALNQEGRDATFFINVSAASLRDPEFVSQIGQALFASGVKAKRLIFEADEAALTAQPAVAASFIKALAKIGCPFTIDNFGKGPAALDHLRDLPIKCVKIDGGLIQNVMTDAVAQTTLKAVVEVAKALDMKTIAKSVEKAESLATLYNFGIDYVQGNYFQQAEGDTGYEFEGETTLSSDEPSAPHWATGGKKR